MKIRHLRILLALVPILSFCTKKDPGNNNNNNPPGKTDTTIAIKPQIDPALSPTIGFFMNDWQEKSFNIPSSFNQTTAPTNTGYTISIDRSNVLTKISRSIAGNNANGWMGDMISEPNLLNHITALNPHIIRFPGGSASDIYFWNAPAYQPPADAPAKLVNADGTTTDAGYWYGTNNANWTISVDKYYQMLTQTGNQGLITINYGYARYGTTANPVATAAHLAADWVRYDNGRTKYWEIGNENFGDWEAGYRINTANNKDGQPEFLTGALYGQHFKVFADSMRKAAQEIGKTIYIGAVASEATPPSWGTPTLKGWNTGLFSAAGSTPDYYVVHNYYTNYKTNASAAEILATPQSVTGTMMDYVKQAMASASLPIKPVVLDEWNIFSTGSMQQVSHINGLHAVLILGEAIKNQFGLTARWDLVNAWEDGNDHGMFNAGDEPGGVPKWNPRPAFFHMYYFQKYLGDRLIASSSSSAELVSYASSFSSGQTAVTLVNKGNNAKSVEIKISNFKMGSRFYWYTLTGGGDNGEFSRKVIVNGIGPDFISGGPTDYTNIKPYAATTSNGIKISVPAHSSVFIVVDKG